MLFRPGTGIPDRLETARFVLRPLRADDAALDLDAVLSSASLLRRWGGTGWPRAGFTLGENRAELAVHQEEHQAAVSFTYTVLSPDGGRCLGCVYVVPGSRLVADGEVPGVGVESPVVSFWLRTSLVEHGLDETLFHVLENWFVSAWPRATWRWATNERFVEQVGLFERVGLRREAAHRDARVDGLRLLFRR